MSHLGGNYTPEEWPAIKAKRRAIQARLAEQAVIDVELHAVLTKIRLHQGLRQALRLLLTIDPRHTLVRSPRRIKRKIDHYQVSRKVHSPKSNPELVLGESITRTIYMEADTFTGLDLSREECELYGVLKLWNEWQHEDEWAFRKRLTIHFQDVLNAWDAADRDAGQFIHNALEEQERLREAAGLGRKNESGEKKPRRKNGEGGDAMNRVVISLDVLTAIEVM